MTFKRSGAALTLKERSMITLPWGCILNLQTAMKVRFRWIGDWRGCFPPGDRSSTKMVSMNFSPMTNEAVGTIRIRSVEHTSELQSLMRISYAVICLKKQTNIHVNRTLL